MLWPGCSTTPSNVRKAAQGVYREGQSRHQPSGTTQAATDSDAILAIAKDSGFSIAAGDLKAGLSKVSDAELESAAGGQVTGGRKCPPSDCTASWNQVRTWTVNWVVCLIDDAFRE